MNIIPKAKDFSENGTLTINATFMADEKLLSCKKAFSRIVFKIYGVHIKDGEGGIELLYDASLSKDEYKIDGAKVYASDKEGASNGLATMLQLMEKSEEGFTLRNTKIRQKPDKDFRAFMTDLARQWHDFEALIGYVDLCYLNKIKYLQLHFTDDPIWTYPMDEFPRLGKEGTKYSKEEIKYLVEYAEEAGVQLIPEFEGIGHSKQLILAYPELFGNTYEEETEEVQAVTGPNMGKVDNIMCIGKPGIFENIQKMLADIAKTFKYSKYIHIGCDEAKHENWSHCSDCKAYMERQRIDSTKKLYSHFVEKIVDMCISLGKTPIVWEGFPYEGTENISRDCVVVAWESHYQLAPELLESGFKIINAAWKPMYIVPPHHKSLQWSVTDGDWNVYKWQHFMAMSAAYPDPIVVEPTDRVLGGMLCQWECCLEEERPRVLLNLPMTADRTWNVEGFYTDEEFHAAKAKVMEMSEKLI